MLSLIPIIIALIIGIILGKNKAETERANIAIATIESSFSDIASLATEEYSFTNVGVLDKEKKKLFFISVPFTGKNMLVVYSGVIKAGIKDYSDIKVNADQITKKIVIKSPEPEIFEDPVIDPSSIEVYNYTDNVFTHVTPDDFKDFEIEQQEVSRQNALDNGLIQRARSHAETLLKMQVNSIIENTKYKNYTVHVDFYK